MSYFTSKLELTKKEQLVENCLQEALLNQSTEIHCDTKGKRYAIFNEECHFKMTLIADSYMIRITNTISNDGEKYREKFINHIIDMIVLEKHLRMEKMFDSVEDTMLRLANDMYQLLKLNNQQNAPVEKEPVTCENAQLEARIEAVLGMNLNGGGETVIG